MNRKELRSEYPVEPARPVDCGIQTGDSRRILEAEEIRGLGGRTRIC